MKTWLITGCSSGIGAGIAKAALENGDRVAVTARRAESVQGLTDAYPQTAMAIALDVTSRESIHAAVKEAMERFGQIDVLVNNAGYGYRSAVEEGVDSEVDLLFATNFFGPVNLIKEVLPQMRRNRSGLILNVSSIAAARSGIGSGYYAASKAALELMTDALSKELRPLGIQVMIVEPGSFRTRFYDDSLKDSTLKIDDYAETAGKRRKDQVINQHNQPGDPDKAGKILIDLAGREQLPLRLLLGSDAVQIVRDELESRLQELETWQLVSRQTDF